jgi:ferric-dicitrate binding protein FerR (iron transport regulator)
MDQETVWILMSKRMAGEATAREAEELELLFLADPRLRQQFDFIRGLKEIPPEGLTEDEEKKIMEKALKKLDLSAEGKYQGRISIPDINASSELPDKESVHFIRSRRWIAAASMVAILLTGTLFYLRETTKKTDQPPAKPKELATQYGFRSFITLPDGSEVWLNAGTKLQYADAFANGKRELTLTGEAYFDVKHDPQHPFIIHTGRLDVKVLGTAFNVKAYPGDSLMETTLIRGKVEIDFIHDLRPKIILKPNEKVVIHTNNNEIRQEQAADRSTSTVSKASEYTLSEIVPDPADGSIAETCWMENKLVFRNEPFARLALKLERWYAVNIHFNNNKYKEDELTGTFRDQSIEDVMHALQLSSGFHYQITGKDIRIW